MPVHDQFVADSKYNSMPYFHYVPSIILPNGYSMILTTTIPFHRAKYIGLMIYPGAVVAILDG